MARLTPEEEKGLMEAYAKVYEQKNLQEGPLDAIPMTRDRQNRQNRINALKSTAKPFMNQGTVTVSSNNATGTPQRVGGGAGGSTGGSVGSAGGSTGGSVKVDGKALMNKLRAGSSGGGAGGSVGSAAGQAAGQAAVKKPGLLGRLGSLAGKAVKTAGNVAGNVAGAARNVAGAARNVAGNVASGIKSGVQAVGSALANKGPMQGSRSRFNNRGGSSAGGQGASQQTQQPVQKMGSIEKSNRAIHGDAKIDALKSKNAEFQAAKKSGNLAQYRKDNPKLSGAERAQQMARERIAAKKAQPAQSPQRRITQVMDLESYDPIFDETVHFLVSEGHVKDESEAISIMSEPEFIESFNEELYG